MNHRGLPALPGSANLGRDLGGGGEWVRVLLVCLCVFVVGMGVGFVGVFVCVGGGGGEGGAGMCKDIWNTPADLYTSQVVDSICCCILSPICMRWCYFASGKGSEWSSKDAAALPAIRG